MSSKRRTGTVLSESESDEEERSRALSSLESNFKAQKTGHKQKSPATARPSGDASSSMHPSSVQHTSGRLSPSIATHPVDSSNSSRAGPTADVTHAADYDDLASIKRHIESLNAHISSLKSELGALKETHIQQQVRYDTQVDFLYDQLRRANVGNSLVIPPLPFGDKPCPGEPDPKCTNPRPMSAGQLAKLSEVLKKAPNTHVHQGQFETIMRLGKAPEVYQDSQIDLNALTSRQKWLLYFVNRHKDRLALVDILTEEERRVIQTATEAASSTETVEDDLPADQQLLTPALYASSREELREAMHSAAAVALAAEGDDSSSVMATSEQGGDGADAAGKDGEEGEEGEEGDEDVSELDMFGEDSAGDPGWD